MEKEELKKKYKKYIKDTLKDINKNINSILNVAFKNNANEIEIIIKVLPGEIVSWSFKEDIHTNPIQSVEEMEENDEYNR